MKKILGLVLVLLMMSNFVFAETPMLISVDEEIRGYVISYENQTLTLEVEGQEYPVTIYDQNNAFYEELSQVKERDHVVVTASRGEATFLMTGVVGISPIMYSPLPEVINATLFTVEQNGDEFTLIFSENASTGYIWQYKINKPEHVSYVSDEYVVNSELLGAPGERKFTFKVNDLGVSTISFKKARAVDEVSDSVDVLVYKTADKLFVEEDQIVSIAGGQVQDGATINNTNNNLYINEELLDLDVQITEVDGVKMIPLAEPLRKLGYTVTWNAETQSVEIKKGASWTSITVGKNAYFKNRMAATPLSSAPIIINDRTMVPAEFFNVILDLGIQIESGSFKIQETGNAQYSGYVKKIVYDETGMMSIHLVSDLENEMADIIIHTSSAYTYKQIEVKEGDFVNAITSSITTRSIPPQTSGVIIY